jgi:hypothetical protein
MEKRMNRFKLKEELGDEARQEIEGLLGRCLNATISKGSKGR